MESIAQSHDDKRQHQMSPVTPSDWALFVGDTPWVGTDRPKITGIINDVLQGSLELLGLPRIETSAEHYAAVISFFVSERNQMVACSWCELEYNPLSNADIALAKESSETRIIPAKQIFALVSQANGQESRAEFRARWEKRTKQSLEVSDGQK